LEEVAAAQAGIQSHLWGRDLEEVAALVGIQDYFWGRDLGEVAHCRIENCIRSQMLAMDKKDY
jgi:hypothetical protein